MELLRFCSQDRNHVLGTIVVIWLVFSGLESLIRAWRQP